MTHAEAYVKVNAPVDQGIAPLITALSEIDGLETIESCQGEPGGRAFVIFRFGEWRRCGEFLFDHLMAEMPADLRSEVKLTLDAYDTDNCLGEISLSPEAIDPLIECVRRASLSVGPSVAVTGDAHRLAISKIV